MAEKNRRIVALPYGEGLERSKGRTIVSPLSFEDLREVFQFDGKAQVRNGLLQKSVLQDDGPTDLDVTVMIGPLRAESAAMGVGYNTNATTNREVWANRMEVDGTTPLQVGQLGTLEEAATFTPPVIIGADSDNRFFFAHDEPLIQSRFPTQFYDPMTNPPLNTLTADLDGTGEFPIFFRGVVRHLSYIFGWGFGNVNDPNRGDVVRVSNSGDSTQFEDFAFFEAGQKGEVVMVARSAGPTLMVFKETETYEIFGYSPDTFGIRLSDALYGCVSSRLAVSVAGTVFFWSTEGPRLTAGGPSRTIEVPLDIGGPDPVGLVEESEPQDAFAAYDPQTRVVNFVWGRRVYALSIRDLKRPRWSYYELGETAQCGSILFSTQSQAGSGGVPTGHPEISGFSLIFPLRFNVDITNVGQTGGEIIEVWVSKDGGANYLHAGSGVGPDEFASAFPQTLIIREENSGTSAPIVPLTDYLVAVRYIRGGLVEVAYQGEPSTWPAVSQDTVTTLGDPLVFNTRAGGNQGLWDRPSGAEGSDQITFTFQQALPPHETLDIEIFREQQFTPGTPEAAGGVEQVLQLIATIPAAGIDRFVDTDIALPVVGNAKVMRYQIRYSNGANKGPFPAIIPGPTFLRCYAGPDPPIQNSLSALPGDEGQGPPFFVINFWSNATTPTPSYAGVRVCPSQGPSEHSTQQMWSDVQVFGPGYIFGALAFPFGTISVTELTGAIFIGDDIRTGIRHRVDSCGAFVYSEFCIIDASPNFKEFTIDP